MANKIIGGIESSVARHPYTALLYDGFGVPSPCTGFLIAPNLVLTESSNKCTDEIRQVGFGCTDTNDDSTCDEIIDVDYVRQDYNDVELTNTGLGLIILTEDSKQTPVRVLDMHEDFFSYRFVGTVVSFGSDEYYGGGYYSSDKLMEAEVTLVEGKPCLSQYTSTINIKNEPYALVQPLSDNYFCSEQVNENVRICEKNDRGAGVILKCESDSTQDILLGVNINSFGCEQDGMPPIYSKLNSFEAMAFLRQYEDRDIVIEFAELSRSCSIGYTTTDVVPTPYPTIPNQWFCQGSKFAGGDACDCNCGQFDPDCEFPENPVVGCLPDQTCNLDGNCVFDNALEPSVPVGWICDPALYDDGEFCDCNCGVSDPDCAKTEFVRGCLPEQTCGSTGRCEGTGKAVPTEWQCIHSFYGTFDGCDCNCGAIDPDCSVEGQQVIGCSEDKPFCLGGECQTLKQVEEQEEDAKDPEEGEETKSVSVTFDGTILGVAFFATVALMFTVHTVFIKAKKQAAREVEPAEALSHFVKA